MTVPIKTASLPCYISHPLGREGEQRKINVKRASVWLSWLTETFDILPLAGWITFARVWPNTAYAHSLGLGLDLQTIELVHQLGGANVMFGELMSEGMIAEYKHAEALGLRTFSFVGILFPQTKEDVRDLTRYGKDQGLTLRSHPDVDVLTQWDIVGVHLEASIRAGSTELVMP